jgi:hypothetical protein
MGGIKVSPSGSRWDTTKGETRTRRTRVEVQATSDTEAVVVACVRTAAAVLP